MECFATLLQRKTSAGCSLPCSKSRCHRRSHSVRGSPCHAFRAKKGRNLPRKNWSGRRLQLTPLLESHSNSSVQGAFDRFQSQTTSRLSKAASFAATTLWIRSRPSLPLPRPRRRSKRPRLKHQELQLLSGR